MTAPLRRLARAVRALVVCALACVTMAACAAIPTTGPVVPGDGGDSTGDPYGSYVRLLPAGPQPGVAPEGLVSGFLKDMGSFEDNHEAARSYMVGDLADEWSPDGSVRVFEDLDTVDLDAHVSADELTAEVRMRSSLVARIDEDGKYIPEETDELFDVTFDLARADEDPDGEWRIQNMPDELILSQLDVERTHHPFNLYYPNQEGTALVPDPVYLPVSPDQLGERLLRRLVSGPTDWLEPAVNSAFPSDATPTLEVDSEEAVISVTGAEQPDEYQMGAQIAWTLRQLPEIQEFTLTVNGSEVDFPGADGESADRPRPGSEYWSEVSPGATSSGIHAYFTHEGQLWSADDWDTDTFGEAERVPGPLGAGDIQLERFAVSMDETTIAGTSLDGGEVVTSQTAAGAEVEEVLSDGTFTELSWDVNGHLWVVEETEEREAPEEDDEGEEAEVPDPEGGEELLNGAEPPPEPGTSALWMLRDGNEVVEVDLSALRDQSLLDFQISRDGTRAAVVTEVDGERSLQVGRVVQDGDGQVEVGSFITLAKDLEDVADVAWRSGDQLAVLGSREGGTSQAFLVSLEGGAEPASAGAPVAGMTTISGAPGQPLVAGSDDGNVWLSNDRLNWQNVVEGVAPTFPG